MPEPKWVISMGACAHIGGVFQQLAIVQGCIRSFPSMFTCRLPPRPEALLYPSSSSRKKIDNHEVGLPGDGRKTRRRKRATSKRAAAMDIIQ